MNSGFNIFGKKVEISRIANVIELLAKFGLIILIIVSMLLLNHSTLLSPDDYNYTYVQGRGDRTKVDSVSNALETAKYFYFNWTGRVLPHVMVGIFRNLPDAYFEIINSMVFLIFIIIITKVLNKKSTFLGILSVFGYLSFSKMFGEKFAWISGSCNYLWPSTLLVIFIYFFYNYFVGNNKLKILSKILLGVFASITAFTHENVAFVGGAFLVCLIAFNFKTFLEFEKTKKIAIILIFIMFCLGAAGTIFAPGNFIRMDTENRSFSLDFLQNYIENKWVLLTVLVSMIIAFIAENAKSIKDKNLKEADYLNIKTELLFFILPALIASIPMAVIGYFPPRAFLAYETMFMIVFARNVYIISEKIEKRYFILAVLSIVFPLIVFGRFSPSTLRSNKLYNSL